MIAIFDIHRNCFWADEDGEMLLFENEIAAKNFVYTQQYTYEFMTNNLKFILCNQ